MPDANGEEPAPLLTSVDTDGDDDQHIDSSASSFPDTGAAVAAASVEALPDGDTGDKNSAKAIDAFDNLLANLAEDNANSLPSGGGGDNADNDATFKYVSNHSQPNEADEAVLLDADSSASTDAIADDLPNDDGDLVVVAVDSQATLADAEMVSEDELPPPPPRFKPSAAATVVPVTVDDAEEVSDEELPGPRLAELPADTEVVSEDELPSSNKIKRKADEDYDPCSPTESSEATAAGVAATATAAATTKAGAGPEKRAKTAADGELI